MSSPSAGRGASKRSAPDQAAESPWRASRERAPHREVKRDAVVRAAAKLFTARGFKGTSLDDIAASLGVTKPTLYNYIANKEEILFAM